MSGWIYCITNSLYKMDDMYKLGYTANKQTPELVKQHLIQRYGTYFPDVECIELFEVKQPIQAEKQLFELLKDYKHNNEIYKADYELIIKPQLYAIKTQYCCSNNERIITELEKQKCKTKLSKKLNNFVKHLFQIQNYIMSNMNKYNKHNSQIISNTYNCLSYYNGQCFPVQDKKMMNFYKQNLITNLSCHIQQFDYNDLEILSLVEYIFKLV
jgi:hypothetical protein